MEPQRGVLEGIRRLLELNAKYQGAVKLKSNTETSPYVVNVLEGSLASLDHSEAIKEVDPGTDNLVHYAESDTVEMLLPTLIKEGLTETKEVIQLVNVKKDESHITAEQAIEFFLTYNNTGVEMSKVSKEKANARGFYNITVLKVIATGLGINLKASASKGDYVDAISSFYQSNQSIISSLVENRRTTITLSTELENEPVAESSGAK
jgi:hypothetical protein